MKVGGLTLTLQPFNQTTGKALGHKKVKSSNDWKVLLAHTILYMECANMLQTAFQHVGTHHVVYGVRQHAGNSFSACWHTPDAGVVSRGE